MYTAQCTLRGTTGERSRATSHSRASRPHRTIITSGSSVVPELNFELRSARQRKVSRWLSAYGTMFTHAMCRRLFTRAQPMPCARDGGAARASTCHRLHARPDISHNLRIPPLTLPATYMLALVVSTRCITEQRGHLRSRARVASIHREDFPASLGSSTLR